MKMMLNRDEVHVSLTGLSVEFKKDVPTFVPPRLIREIIGIGGTAAEEDKAVEAAALAGIAKEKEQQDARKPAIMAAIRMMHKRNQRGDFTAGARPNLNTLLKETGLEVSAAELEPIWNEVRKELE